ncbi:MAG: tandem-95 repeat protein, partial [Algicola sp.]|nr:tandem-95 repeat protein [Algicola sp.]
IDVYSFVVVNSTFKNSNNGSVTTNRDNTLLFTPTSNFNGNVSIGYTIGDNNGGTASATVTVNVISVNSTPVAVNDSATTDEDILITIHVLANDSDADGDALTVTNPTATNGTVSVNLDSSLNYLPNANFNGSDTISYSVNDGNGGTDSATVAVTITAINDAPVGVADTAVTNEDNAININVLANDTDIDTNASALTVTAVSAINGTATVLSNQTIDYNPAANFNGVDTISYTVKDDLGGFASTTVAVTIVAQNDAPVAIDDNSTTDEDISVIINVLANDSDIDGDTLTIDTAQANNGTVAINADNSLGYTPSDNFNGADTISYTLSDSNGLTASASVAVTVNSVNDLPVAVDDLATTAEDISVNIVVLTNDSDVEDTTLSVTGATATNGTVTVATNNSLDYTPTANFNGTDTISYSIADSNGGTASAVVVVTVSGINDLPIALSDIANTNEDTLININALANDSDPDGDTLSISSATAANGTVSTNTDNTSNNTLDYTPNTNFNGSDTINYTINDGQGGTAASTILVTVAPVNDLPVAVNDSAQVTEDTTININVLANDSDLDGDTLTVTGATAIAGTVTTATDNTLNYTPNSNFNGADTISYTISDGQGGTASSTVTLSVTSVNDNPVANADTATTSEDNGLTVNVLANDSDIDNDTLTIASSSASNGATVVNADQSISYAPNANFNGEDVINYTISDGQGGTASSTVTVTVTAVNDSPVAVSDSSTTAEDTAININVLANDSDIDGDSLSITTFSANSGTVSLASDNTLKYTPDSNFNGFDTINYAISDGNGGIDSATVAVTVSAVNDVPVAVADSVTTLEDTSTTVAVLSNDSDADGDTLTVTAVSATNGTTSIIDNVISYTPNAHFFGSDTISYTIADTNDATASSTVAVTITSVNDVPVAVADSLTTDEDVSFTINVLTNDTDDDGDKLIVTAATTTEGTVSIVSADNTLIYVPTTDFFGSATINYTIEDGNGGSASSTVAVTVNGINDHPVSAADTHAMNEDNIADIDAL